MKKTKLGTYNWRYNMFDAEEVIRLYNEFHVNFEEFDNKFAYGVDVAIKKLRPYSRFTLVNTEFADWWDPIGMPPPSWEEVESLVKLDKARYELYLECKETYKKEQTTCQ